MGQPVPCTLHGALAGPPHPASQPHVPSAPHVPWPLQSATQLLLAHAGAAQPAAQSHVPLRQPPRPEQSASHSSSSHAVPLRPAAHAHVPVRSLHSPCPEHNVMMLCPPMPRGWPPGHSGGSGLAAGYCMTGAPPAWSCSSAKVSWATPTADVCGTSTLPVDSCIEAGTNCSPRRSTLAPAGSSAVPARDTLAPMAAPRASRGFSGPSPGAGHWSVATTPSSSDAVPVPTRSRRPAATPTQSLSSTSTSPFLAG